MFFVWFFLPWTLPPVIHPPYHCIKNAHFNNSLCKIRTCREHVPNARLVHVQVLYIWTGFTAEPWPRRQTLDLFSRCETFSSEQHGVLLCCDGISVFSINNNNIQYWQQRSSSCEADLFWNSSVSQINWSTFETRSHPELNVSKMLFWI